MRRLSISCICLVTVLVASIGAGTAGADVHIGSVVRPSGWSASPCIDEVVIVQWTSEPDTPYTVPPGDRELTQWEMSTTGAAAGAAVTLVVMRPAGGDSYDVLATDAETLPDPLPADEVAAFTPPSPIAVSGGDALGLYSSTGEVGCFFASGATPAVASAAGLAAPVAPAPGQTLPLALPPSSVGTRLNVAATLHGDQDLGVTTTASPAGPTVGALALLGSTVTNHGPESGPVIFSDTVPSGLTIESAVAGSGICTTAGRTVSCTIEGLAMGQSAPVSILVTPTAPGSYVNTVSVAPQAGTVDPVPGDDSASATLHVAAPPATTSTKPTTGGASTRACVVPNLRRVRLASARRLLVPLGCKAGKVRHLHNRKIAKGTVVRTSPKPGTYAAGRKVGLVVSSGPPRHRHRGRG